MRNLLIVTVLLSYTCTCFHFQEEVQCGELGGECISIENCDVLKQRIQKGSSEDLDNVTKLTCGFDEMVPRVCCPQRQSEICLTPERTFGSCVSIEMCPYLLTRFNSVRENDIQYVERARCDGPSPNSVCCDPVDVTPKPVIPNRNNTSCSSASQIGFISVDRVSNNNSCCGNTASNTNKIIGGERTALDAYPWLALLEYRTNRGYYCGGSLISSIYVLTAAHCLETTTKISRGVNAVRLGEYDTTNEGRDCVEAPGGGPDCTDGAVTIPIIKVIVHPDFLSVKNVQIANDIGLLRLSKSAPYTDFIRPICLPSSDVTKMAIPSNLTFQAAGWGEVSGEKLRSDVKLEVDLPFLEQKKCEERFSMYGISMIWDKQFCAGGELNKDSCRGDSGGPLIYSDEDSKTHQIVGITSFGNSKCGIQGRPSIYTKVIEYVPWILDTIKVQS